MKLHKLQRPVLGVVCRTQAGDRSYSLLIRDTGRTMTAYTQDCNCCCESGMSHEERYVRS